MTQGPETLGLKTQSLPGLPDASSLVGFYLLPENGHHLARVCLDDM